MFKLVSAGFAPPHVPNAALGPMLRPFWCNDNGTTQRTLNDWPFMHGDDPSLSSPNTTDKVILKAIPD